MISLRQRATQFTPATVPPRTGIVELPTWWSNTFYGSTQNPVIPRTPLPPQFLNMMHGPIPKFATNSVPWSYYLSRASRKMNVAAVELLFVELFTLVEELFRRALGLMWPRHGKGWIITERPIFERINRLACEREKSQRGGPLFG